MANLYSGSLDSNGEYLDLAEATGVTFATGNTYQIQFLNQGFIREGEEGTGFFITSINPFSIKCTDTIYVCSSGKLGINIAE